MEAKKKSRVKFNFFDVTVIILVALFVTAFSYIYFLGSDSSYVSVNGESIEYKLEIEMVDESFANLVSAGDEITSVETGARIGYVKNVETYDRKEVFTTSDGGATVGGVEGYINILLTVECIGEWEDEATVVTNGFRIRQGLIVDAHTPKLTFSANCTSVEKAVTNSDGGEE